MLQHCPDELETELRNQEAWVDIDAAQSVVDLLILIRDLQYNKTDRKRSIMATVQADFDLYTCSQNGEPTTIGCQEVHSTNPSRTISTGQSTRTGTSERSQDTKPRLTSGRTTTQKSTRSYSSTARRARSRAEEPRSLGDYRRRAERRQSSHPHPRPTVQQDRPQAEHHGNSPSQF